MNRKNFDALIDHLESIPKKAFGMDLWMTGSLANFSGCDLGFRNRAEVKKVLKEQLKNDEHTCGTVACIAGYASMLAVANGDVDAKVAVALGAEKTATKWLGLDTESADDARSLFHTLDANVEIEDVKRRHAVKVLKHYRKTGKVRWDKFT